MKFTEAHLDLMLAHRVSYKKMHLLSATKQKLARDLIIAGAMKEDDEGYVFNSEAGDTILELTIREFDRLFPRTTT